MMVAMLASIIVWVALLVWVAVDYAVQYDELRLRDHIITRAMIFTYIIGGLIPILGWLVSLLIK